jgi:hypothetical protein
MILLNRYEACWKAVMAEADGVLLVYNPDAPGQDQQLVDWFDFFVKKNGLRDEQCLIFAHRVNPTNERFRPRMFSARFSFFLFISFSFLAQLFSRVSALVTGLNNLSDMKGMFENFVKDLISYKNRK